MNCFEAIELCGDILSLEQQQEELRHIVQRHQDNASVDDSVMSSIHEIVAAAEKICRDLKFENAQEKIRLTNIYLSEKWRTLNAAALETELRNVEEAILTEVRNNTYLYVQKGRAGYVDNPALFGQDVASAFPSAKSDIKEAGNCLAAECNTAAVFHLMRAVEWGLRALCAHLGLRKVKSVTKSGKKKYTPISYVDWEHMLNQLNPLVDAKIEKMKRGQEKQKHQEFYYPMLQDIKAIRDAWRNHVMHTRAEYTAKQADEILEHVERFMRSLATRVRAT